MTLARQLAEFGEHRETELAASVEQVNNYRLRAGLLIVISDFFEPAGLSRVTETLRNSRHRLLLVQAGQGVGRASHIAVRFARATCD